MSYWGENANGLELMGLLQVAQFHLYDANDDE